VQGGWQLADNTGKDLGRDVIPALPGAAALRRIGIEAAHLSVASHARLLSAGGREYIPTTGLIEGLRSVKDSAEIQTIRRAVALGEQVFAQLLPLITPAATEADLAAEIEYRARKLGATECSFKPIIASGPRSALPHAGYTAQALQPGQPLSIDMGVVLEGYCSDMTRTVFPGDCPAQWRELYAIVLEAKRRGFGATLAGATGAQADSAARDYIAERGYGAQFGHGLGHGVGIQIHEAPSLIWTAERRLEPGNVVTCEPGIYRPGQGGIRIEDMTLVTDSGPQNLTR
jgi:Xaa-Pro aminopeptidase